MTGRFLWTHPRLVWFGVLALMLAAEVLLLYAVSAWVASCVRP